mmetsp:Transcript_25046/g.52021  ORF Transcript_25046/g.52021 Transcript_25046/m.52021 type:complete len:261 (+) Transcript_25046:169-951(+)
MTLTFRVTFGIARLLMPIQPKSLSLKRKWSMHQYTVISFGWGHSGDPTGSSSTATFPSSTIGISSRSVQATCRPWRIKCRKSSPSSSVSHPTCRAPGAERAGGPAVDEDNGMSVRRMRKDLKIQSSLATLGYCTIMAFKSTGAEKSTRTHPILVCLAWRLTSGTFTTVPRNVDKPGHARARPCKASSPETPWSTRPVSGPFMKPSTSARKSQGSAGNCADKPQLMMLAPNCFPGLQGVSNLASVPLPPSFVVHSPDGSNK